MRGGGCRWAHQAVSTINSAAIKRISLQIAVAPTTIRVYRNVAFIDWTAIDNWIPPSFELLELVLSEHRNSHQIHYLDHRSLYMVEENLVNLMPKAVGRNLVVLIA